MKHSYLPVLIPYCSVFLQIVNDTSDILKVVIYLDGHISKGVKITMFKEEFSEVTGKRCLDVSIIVPSVVEDCVVDWQLRSLQFCTITICPACSIGSPQRRAVRPNV